MYILWAAADSRLKYDPFPLPSPYPPLPFSLLFCLIILTTPPHLLSSISSFLLPRIIPNAPPHPLPFISPFSLARNPSHFPSNSSFSFTTFSTYHYFSNSSPGPQPLLPSFPRSDGSSPTHQPHITLHRVGKLATLTAYKTSHRHLHSFITFITIHVYMNMGCSVVEWSSSEIKPRPRQKFETRLLLHAQLHTPCSASGTTTSGNRVSSKLHGNSPSASEGLIEWVIVIVNSKLLKRHSKPSAGHQLIHERCVKSEGFPKE